MARDLQFELFLAAHLVHSGYSMRLNEPDIIFIHEKMPLGIAAKRPTSKQKVVPQIREGVKQLSKVATLG